LNHFIFFPIEFKEKVDLKKVKFKKNRSN